MSTARDAVFAIFAVNGFLLASWMARVPDIKADLGLTAGRLGLLLLAVSVGALIGLPLAGRVAHRIGVSATVCLGAALMWVGLVVTGVAVGLRLDLPPIMGAMLIAGLGNGLWDVAQNLAGSQVEQAAGRSIMAWFHAAFSVGAVVGALVGAVLIMGGVGVVLHLPVAATVAAAVVWWGTRSLPAATATEPDQHHVGSAWREPRTLLIGLVVLAAAFTEGAANDWLAVAFVEGHHVGTVAGVVALAVFLASMTLGRVFGAGLLDRYGRVAVLRGTCVAAILGCAMVVFGGAALAFVGVVVWGFGASLGFPVGMSAAADDPARAAARISVVSTIGYTAFLAGPPLVGFLGDQVGVLTALLAVATVSLCALPVITATRPQSESAGQSPGAPHSPSQRD